MMSGPLGHRALRRGLVAAIVVAAVVAMGGSTVSAAQAPVGLGTADNFAVLAGQGITNTGPTTITGDVGTFPNTAETGFGSVTLVPPSTNRDGDAVTQQAKSDLVTAYNDAAGRTPVTQEPSDLVGLTLVPGVYDSADGTLANSGSLTLNGAGVYIFQASSTLITSSSSSVVLENGANPCDVFWQVGSSATLGTNSTFVGTIMALTSITVTTGATLQGRVLASNGAVTLDNNTITRSACTTPTSTTTTVTSSANPSTTGQSVTLTASVTATGGGTPTGSVTFFDNGVALGTIPLNSSGQATFTTSALGPGSHSITAVYLGGPGFEFEHFGCSDSDRERRYRSGIHRLSRLRMQG